jgi:hypothetical protein
MGGVSQPKRVDNNRNWFLSNKTGNVYILEYSDIPKVFFMPHLCSVNAILSYSCTTACSKNYLPSFISLIRSELIVAQQYVSKISSAYACRLVHRKTATESQTDKQRYTSCTSLTLDREEALKTKGTKRHVRDI